MDNVHAKTMVDKIHDVMSAAKAASNAASAPAAAPQSPMDLLKTKFVNGEITEEEFERKKNLLK